MSRDRSRIGLEDLYSFVEKYLEEDFEVESVLSFSPKGSVRKLRHKRSHKRYICRNYPAVVDAYLALKGVQCPYLPRIYEAACRVSEQQEMLVLEEYIQGDTLEELLQGGALESHQVKTITLQLCRGLYVCHSLGLVHRDIKPENVILQGKRAVLIDFDAARLFFGEKNKRKDTQILGTVGYAPPEQYGISGTDNRADIYAMGVLINEMLTGQHPSRTLAGGRWGHIVSRCTMIQPKKRYASVHELMEAL